MDAYSVLLTRSAAREIENLDSNADRRAIVDRIGALSLQPRPRGCEKLAGQMRAYRIRYRALRVVYEIDDATRSVKIVRVGHRRDVYRRG